jgi:hypothetical protein
MQPHSVTPRGVSRADSGLLQDLQPHIIHRTGAAGRLAQHYHDDYLHRQDEAFLRARAPPFLRETAHFYEDFLVVDDTGTYLSLPSNSPENTPGNRMGKPGRGRMKTTINATMDFAIAKEVLTHLIEGAFPYFLIFGILILPLEIPWCPHQALMTPTDTRDHLRSGV